MLDLIGRIQQRLTAFAQASIFKDSFWMLLSQGGSAIIQTIYFILVARYLGSEKYGIFEGIKSIAAIIFPFVGCGIGDVLVQQVSRDRALFSKYWGDSLIAFVGSVSVLLVIIFPLTLGLLPSIPPLFVLLILSSDLIGLKLSNLAGQAFASIHQIKPIATIKLIYVISKFITALGLPFFADSDRLMAWGILYWIGSVIPGFFFLTIVNRSIEPPRFNILDFQVSQLKQGFFFSLSESASGINAQADRTMLVALSSPVAAGIYGAGYRFIDMGYLPIFAILTATYARFFKHGEAGIKGTLGFAKRLLPVAVLYGIVAAIGLLTLSSFVPKILGDEYAASSTVLIWFAPIHLIAGLQLIAADTLTGAGFQRPRSFVQVTAAIINVSLNFYLIPIYSWQGAIWATLTSELFKLITLWIIVFIVHRRYAQV